MPKVRKREREKERERERERKELRESPEIGAGSTSLPLRPPPQPCHRQA